jgi:hypothetical protein
MIKSVADWADDWSIEDLQQALDAVYDSELEEQLPKHNILLADLVALVQMDTEWHQYLMHLAKHDWDKTAAKLAWNPGNKI